MKTPKPIPVVCPATKYDQYSRDQLIQHLLERDATETGGLHLTYPGQTPPWLIVRRVLPRRTRIEPDLCVGSEEEQSRNVIVEGENLQSMVSLYKYRGQVDMVLTDPPYNTGKDFRYNDKWDNDPNDPDLGRLVPPDDGSRHSKWLRFMTPRLYMMREMLKAAGVLAICIDYRELFRLGLLLDGIFGEENRLGIINWQKSYAPRNDQKHVSTATEYVLVYAKSDDSARTSPLPRTAAMNARYKSPDGDPRPWKESDISARGAQRNPGMVYAIQSPFTGRLHYPPPGRTWCFGKTKMRAFLEEWGCEYEERQLTDGKHPALVLKGTPQPDSRGFSPGHPGLKTARDRAEARLSRGTWPVVFWNAQGQGSLARKKYLEDVRKGVVPWTYWASDDYESPLAIDSTSWAYEQSGHSQTGIRELDALVGRGHNFETVKPLNLIKKIIQIWCPPNGIVLDPFAGSGTTAHAVLDLNASSDSTRRFILIEQGAPEKGDHYARSLTRLRVARAIAGEKMKPNGKVAPDSEPLPGGFRFVRLLDKIDGEAVLALKREEMIDLLLTTHWDQSERSASHLQREPAGRFAHLFARNARGEGFFLVWTGPDRLAALDRQTFKAIAEEARRAGLKPPYHVYARICTYAGPNIEFYQIPNRILEKLGFSEATDPFLSSRSE